MRLPRPVLPTAGAVAALLSLSALLPIALVGAPSCKSDGCDLDGAAKERAGGGATFCGHVPVDPTPAVVNAAKACVESALSATPKKSFWVRFDTQGGEMPLARAIVGRTDGTVQFLTFQGSPCGSNPGCSDRLTGRTCFDPFFQEGRPSDPVGCGRMGDATNLCD